MAIKESLMGADILYWLPKAFVVLSALSGAIAAFNWFRSSQVYLPDYNSVPVGEYETNLHLWAQKSSRLNKWAALWTAATMGFTAASAAIVALT